MQQGRDEEEGEWRRRRHASEKGGVGIPASAVTRRRGGDSGEEEERGSIMLGSDGRVTGGEETDGRWVWARKDRSLLSKC